LTSLEISLNELKERKRRHQVLAPQGWVVTDKQVEVGEIVGPNTVLAQVADYRTLVVPLALSTAELTALQMLSREMDVNLEGKPAKARLRWINPQFDERTRKRQVELVLTEFEGPAWGGLLLTLEVPIDTEGILIPKQALINRYENPRVEIASNGERVRIMLLGEAAQHFVAAEDGRLPPGTELVAQENINPATN
jgi:hypothetical protein